MLLHFSPTAWGNVANSLQISKLRQSFLKFAVLSCLQETQHDDYLSLKELLILVSLQAATVSKFLVTVGLNVQFNLTSMVRARVYVVFSMLVAIGYLLVQIRY